MFHFLSKSRAKADSIAFTKMDFVVKIKSANWRLVDQTQTSESFRSLGLLIVISHVTSRGVILIANQPCFASGSNLYLPVRVV